MGLEYKIVPSTRKELSGATCDKCGKRIKVDGPGLWNPFGEPYSVYHEPCLEEEVFVLENSWGYFSHKDTQHHSVVLCEGCYDIVFKDVKIKITEYKPGV